MGRLRFTHPPLPPPLCRCFPRIPRRHREGRFRPGSSSSFIVHPLGRGTQHQRHRPQRAQQPPQPPQPPRPPLQHSHGRHGSHGNPRNPGEQQRRQAARRCQRFPYRRDRTSGGSPRPVPLRQERSADWARCCHIRGNRQWVSCLRGCAPPTKNPVRLCPGPVTATALVARACFAAFSGPSGMVASFVSCERVDLTWQVCPYL